MSNSLQLSNIFIVPKHYTQTGTPASLGFMRWRRSSGLSSMQAFQNGVMKCASPPSGSFSNASEHIQSHLNTYWVWYRHYQQGQLCIYCYQKGLIYSGYIAGLWEECGRTDKAGKWQKLRGLPLSLSLTNILMTGAPHGWISPWHHTCCKVVWPNMLYSVEQSKESGMKVLLSPLQRLNDYFLTYYW